MIQNKGRSSRGSDTHSEGGTLQQDSPCPPPPPALAGAVPSPSSQWACVNRLHRVWLWKLMNQ